MNERLKKIGTAVKDKWTGFSKVIKILIISIPIAVIAAIVVVVILSSGKETTVLYSGLTNAEAQEISSAIKAMGIEDVSMNNNGEILVLESQADYLRMQLAVQGYPKQSAGYDIWNDGVDLWSTDADKREVQRQQRETRLAATLVQLESVQSATVNLDIPETKDYVIVEDKGVPTCSITLALRDGKELTNSEVRAIYSMVTSSVDGLINDNLSIIDTKGRQYQWISEEEENSGLVDASGVSVGAKRLQFQKEFREALMENLRGLFDPAFGEDGYSINVTAILNYDEMKQTSTEYKPSGDDNTGVLDHDVIISEGAALDSDEGLVGVTPNADESPDYPTYVGLEDGQSYYYYKNEHQYDVSNVVTEIVKDGYSIEKLSVALLIDTNSLSETERESFADIVAKAAGTDVENVSVYNTVFALDNPGITVDKGSNIDIWTRPVDSFRDTLLFVVIALGVLLIVLIIISLFMGRSRKRKIRRRQEQAAAAAAAAANAQPQGIIVPEPEIPEEVDFNIASLTEEAGKDSRETILKREISEFSKSSPEIVASIIKNMLREE